MPASHLFFIRAVNLGGTAMLPMADLRTMAAELGGTDVSTYIASGNLLCTPPDDAFVQSLEGEIEKRFGFFREVMPRSRQEVQTAMDAHPFEVIDPKSSYVSFLTGAPIRAALADAEAIETGDDRWSVIGREQHIRYAVSAGQPQMKGDRIMRALGVVGTARNLLTVQKLLELSA